MAGLIKRMRLSLFLCLFSNLYVCMYSFCFITVLITRGYYFQHVAIPLADYRIYAGRGWPRGIKGLTSIKLDKNYAFFVVDNF